MKRSPPPRFVRLQIAVDAKAALARGARRHGTTQGDLAGRLVAWVVRQPPVVLAAVLNNIGGDTGGRPAERPRAAPESPVAVGDAAPRRAARRQAPKARRAR